MPSIWGKDREKAGNLEGLEGNLGFGVTIGVSILDITMHILSEGPSVVGVGENVIRRNPQYLSLGQGEDTITSINGALRRLFGLCDEDRWMRMRVDRPNHSICTPEIKEIDHI